MSINVMKTTGRGLTEKMLMMKKESECVCAARCNPLNHVIPEGSRALQQDIMQGQRGRGSFSVYQDQNDITVTKSTHRSKLNLVKAFWG